MNLEFYRKQVYGNELRYLVDCEEATAFRELTNKLTISSKDMHHGEALGITFLEVMAP